MAHSGFGEEDPTIVGEHRVLPSVRQRKMPFLLQQIKGPGAPRDYVLDLEEIVVGRSTGAHIAIDSQLISRRHMTLTRCGAEFVCSDLDSANGVYLNGVKAHSAVLREGDTLQIGDVVFVYREGS
jgi:pSer/pThr/pTyr-binding forkhead associated (FHA) protein